MDGSHLSLEFYFSILLGIAMSEIPLANQCLKARQGFWTLLPPHGVVVVQTWRWPDKKEGGLFLFSPENP